MGTTDHTGKAFVDLQHAFPCLNDSYHLSIISSHEMRNKYLITIWHGNKAGEYPLNPFKLLTERYFIQNFMFCICLDWKSQINYNLLQMNERINSEKYCEQLNNLKATIQENRPALENIHGVVF